MNRNLTKRGWTLPHVDRKRALRQSRRLVHEGSIRHLIVRDRKGKTIFEVPASAGLLGIALAPRWALAGTVAALAFECSITVRKA